MMGSAEVVVWACGLLGLTCAAPHALDVATIQAAYEAEAARGSALHDKGLQVLEAGCDAPKGDRSLCQITFVSRDDAEQRLYFDVVAMRRQGAGWILASGLCRR